MNEGPEYAEAEWLSGWIAVTFLDDPNMALHHFQNFYKNVGYPISLSRGAYWIAQTYKKMRNSLWAFTTIINQREAKEPC